MGLAHNQDHLRHAAKTFVEQSSLRDLADQFLVQKLITGRSERTILTYRWWLDQLVQFVGEGELTALVFHRFFVVLHQRGLSDSSRHQAFRTFKTFTTWGQKRGVLPAGLMTGLEIKMPKTLPKVPDDADIRALVQTCWGKHLVSLRDRAMILVSIDTGVRVGELLRLLIEDWTTNERSFLIRAGKGRKDRTVFFSPLTARSIREYLALRRTYSSDEFLFVNTRTWDRIKYRHWVKILHRRSGRAGFPKARRIHPHSLRHWAATSWVRNGMNPEEVRRLLGHESLTMTLRYFALVGRDLQQAHKRASAVERLRLD